MKRFPLLLFALVALLWCDRAARADPDTAEAVSVCGTPNRSPVAGINQFYPLTQNLSQQLCVNIVGTVTVTNPSVGSNNTTAPTSSTQIGTKDASGNLQPVPASAVNNAPLSASLPYLGAPVSGGDQKGVSITTATSLTVPGTANAAVVTFVVTGANWEMDGGTPTASAGGGQPAGLGQVVVIVGSANLSAFKAIAQSSGGLMNASYFTGK